VTEEETAAAYARKLKRAAQMLFFQRHRVPGLRGWELRKSLGKDYMKVVELLNFELGKLGLQVKVIPETSETERPERLTDEELDRARFYITLGGSPTATETQLAGWRIDDLAVLAASLAYILARQGKAPKSEVEKLLKEKLPEWRVNLSLDRFIKMKYLSLDENGVLRLDWRTRAEVDLKTLLELLLTEETTSASSEGKSPSTS
jgi:hypothetical protein